MSAMAAKKRTLEAVSADASERIDAYSRTRRTIVKFVLRGIDHNRVPGQARESRSLGKVEKDCRNAAPKEEPFGKKANQRATIGWPEGRPSGSERVKGWKRERSECGSESKSEKG
jgi:hypothetical protein